MPTKDLAPFLSIPHKNLFYKWSTSAINQLLVAGVSWAEYSSISDRVVQLLPHPQTLLCTPFMGVNNLCTNITV